MSHPGIPIPLQGDSGIRYYRAPAPTPLRGYYMPSRSRPLTRTPVRMDTYIPYPLLGADWLLGRAWTPVHL